MIEVKKMAEHEVELVHESNGWRIYVDDAKAPGSCFEHKDKAKANMDARRFARELNLEEYTIIDFTSTEIVKIK